jgi:hypothetical protein
MYLVTYKQQGDSTFTSIPHKDLTAARTCAEEAASHGRGEVAVWVLTHTVEVVPQAVWKEHARGITAQ